MNSTSNSILVEWRCFGSEKEVLSLEESFKNNVYVYTFVNALSSIFGLLTNSFVIFGACKNQVLGKLSKALTIFLAIEGMLSAVVIQPFYFASKCVLLANIHNPLSVSYCLPMFIVIYATKFLTAFALASMLGITIERYTAVIHPHEYKVYRRGLVKFLIFVLVILLTHFTLGIIWVWYKTISKILTALVTFVHLAFTIYVYVKIYFKLRRSDRVRVSNNTQSGNRTHANSAKRHKKTRSLTSFLIVGSYLLSYLPMVVIRVSKLDKTSPLVMLYLRPWANTFLFSSFSVNALAYGLSSAKISLRMVVTVIFQTETQKGHNYH